MDEKKYEKCDNKYVFNGRTHVSIADGAVLPHFTIERMVVVSGAPYHDIELQRVEVQAPDAGTASRVADRWKFEKEQEIGHHQQRKGNRHACC